jgi:hypothetical protein
VLQQENDLFPRLPATPLILRELAIDTSIALAVSSIFLFGLLALGSRSQSPALRFMANHLKTAMAALAPAVVATLAWPILYRKSGGNGAGVALMIVALLICIAWAWVQTRWITSHLTELMGRKHERLWKSLVFAGQTVGVLASGPIFFGALSALRALNVELDLT